MSDYLYQLEKYKTPKSRRTCPACGERSVFALYQNTVTGDYLAEHVGRCNREDKCGYHYTPAKYFEENPERKGECQSSLVQRPRPIEKALSCIPLKAFSASLSQYNNNCFVSYLTSLLGADKATEAIEKYFIGTSKKWTGANIFWYIDINGRIRTGKIMLYSPVTGKRVKTPKSLIAWVHNYIEGDGNYKQCLFGERLLRVFPNAPVALCESEKTAIIASAYLPEFVWLATGGISNLTYDKCKVLKGRDVVLFPDVNGFDNWTERASSLKSITDFSISDLLERNASEEHRANGWDLADYLIGFDVKEFTSYRRAKEQKITELTSQEDLASESFSSSKWEQNTPAWFQFDPNKNNTEAPF